MNVDDFKLSLYVWRLLQHGSCRINKVVKEFKLPQYGVLKGDIADTLFNLTIHEAFYYHFIYTEPVLNLHTPDESYYSWRFGLPSAVVTFRKKVVL